MILCLEVQDMSRRRLICFLTALVLTVSLCASALALDSGTLKYGSRGEAVRKLQQALIDQGYLKGSADGVFGNKTENAVRAFQKAKKLKVDGLAGKKTQELLYGSSGSKTTSTSGSTSTSSSTTSSSSSAGASSTAAAAAVALGSRVRKGILVSSLMMHVPFC